MQWKGGGRPASRRHSTSPSDWRTWARKKRRMSTEWRDEAPVRRERRRIHQPRRAERRVVSNPMHVGEGRVERYTPCTPALDIEGREGRGPTSSSAATEGAPRCSGCSGSASARATKERVRRYSAPAPVDSRPSGHRPDLAQVNEQDRVSGNDNTQRQRRTVPAQAEANTRRRSRSPANPRVRSTMRRESRSRSPMSSADRGVRRGRGRERARRSASPEASRERSARVTPPSNGDSGGSERRRAQSSGAGIHPVIPGSTVMPVPERFGRQHSETDTQRCLSLSGSADNIPRSPAIRHTARCH